MDVRIPASLSFLITFLNIRENYSPCPLPIPRATAPLGFYFINPPPPIRTSCHDKRSMKGHKFHQRKHFDTLSGLL